VPDFPWAAAARVNLTRTTIRGNQAKWAGGLLVQGDFGGLTSNRAALSLRSSIVAHNTALDYGGGILLDRADATIDDTHVTGNQALASWGGGLLGVGSAVMQVADTIFAGNPPSAWAAASWWPTVRGSS
jgi:hypothetical protein